jgi:hypothetical protein
MEAPSEGQLINEQVIFATTLPDNPYRCFAVTADCRPLISATPESLFFTAILGQSQEQRVLIKMCANNIRPTIDFLPSESGKNSVFRATGIAPVHEGDFSSFFATVDFRPQESITDLYRGVMRVTAGHRTKDVMLVGSVLESK